MALIDGNAMLWLVNPKPTCQSWNCISYHSHAPAWECSPRRSRAVPLERGNDPKNINTWQGVF